MQFFQSPWRSLPGFFLDYPRAADLIEWLQIAKDWIHRYESFILIVGLWLVARKIRRERERLQERVNTLTQHVQAAGEASDAAIVKAQQVASTILDAIAMSTRVGVRSPTAGDKLTSSPEASLEILEGASSNWQQISEIWNNLKQRIELRIEDIPNKRVREKYSRMDRRVYRRIITQLEHDELLRPAVADILRDLARRYQALKFDPANITAAEVQKFVEGQQIVDGSRELAYVVEQDVIPQTVPPVVQSQQRPGAIARPAA